MDRARRRFLKNASARGAGKTSGAKPAGRQAPEAPAAPEPAEPMSLAQSRKRRAVRIARRAAIEAARANGAVTAALDAAERDPCGEGALTPEGVFLDDTALRSAQGARTAGRFAARRARANAIQLARKRRSGAVSRDGGMPGAKAAPAAKGAAAGTAPVAGAQRKAAKSWSLKAVGMDVGTVAAERANPIARFMGGGSLIPRAAKGGPRPKLGWVAGGAAASLVPLLMAGVLVLGLPLAAAAAASVFAAQDQTSTGTLSGNERAIASHLLAADIDQMHVAAIMGNIYKESGYSPTALNGDSGAFGICQWLGGRKANLIELCRGRGVEATDLTTQIDYFLMEFKMEGASGWNSVADRDAFLAISGDGSLDEAVAFFARKFERCGEHEMDLPTRSREAKRVLEALRSGVGGEEFEASSETAKKIAEATLKVPSPGFGLCAMWVSQVYQFAGCGYPGGNANDMYYAWCTSSDRSQLKVGMMVAVPTNDINEDGRRYGHVGIYIGDGQVRHNIGDVKTDSLDDWIATYGTIAEVRWGYPEGVREQ